MLLPCVGRLGAGSVRGLHGDREHSSFRRADRRADDVQTACRSPARRQISREFRRRSLCAVIV